MRVKINKANMKIAMIRKKMGTKDLAEAIGKSEATIYNMMNNKKTATLKTYCEVCMILGVNMEDLIEVEDD